MKLSGQQQMVVNYIAGAMIVNTCYIPTPGLRRTVYSLQRKGLVTCIDWRTGKRYELTAKGKPHATCPYHNGPVVASSELSTVKMVAGNEKRHPKVIMHDTVRQWVGFGWIDEGAPTNGQRNRLPRVVEADWQP